MRELFCWGLGDGKSSQGWMFRGFDCYWQAYFDPGYGTYDHTRAIRLERAITDDYGNLVTTHG